METKSTKCKLLSIFSRKRSRRLNCSPLKSHTSDVEMRHASKRRGEAEREGGGQSRSPSFNLPRSSAQFQGSGEVQTGRAAERMLRPTSYSASTRQETLRVLEIATPVNNCYGLNPPYTEREVLRTCYRPEHRCVADQLRSHQTPRHGFVRNLSQSPGKRCRRRDSVVPQPHARNVEFSDRRIRAGLSLDIEDLLGGRNKEVSPQGSLDSGFGQSPPAIPSEPIYANITREGGIIVKDMPPQGRSRSADACSNYTRVLALVGQSHWSLSCSSTEEDKTDDQYKRVVRRTRSQRDVIHLTSMDRSFCRLIMNNDRSSVVKNDVIRDDSSTSHVMTRGDSSPSHIMTHGDSSTSHVMTHGDSSPSHVMSRGGRVPEHSATVHDASEETSRWMSAVARFHHPRSPERRWDRDTRPPRLGRTASSGLPPTLSKIDDVYTHTSSCAAFARWRGGVSPDHSRDGSSRWGVTVGVQRKGGRVCGRRERGADAAAHDRTPSRGESIPAAAEGAAGHTAQPRGRGGLYRSASHRPAGWLRDGRGCNNDNQFVSQHQQQQQQEEQKRASLCNISRYISAVNRHSQGKQVSIVCYNYNNNNNNNKVSKSIVCYIINRL